MSPDGYSHSHHTFLERFFKKLTFRERTGRNGARKEEEKCGRKISRKGNEEKNERFKEKERDEKRRDEKEREKKLAILCRPEISRFRSFYAAIVSNVKDFIGRKKRAPL